MLVKFWGVRGSIPTPVSTGRITGKIIRALSSAKGVDLDDPQAVRAYVESLPLEIRGTCGGNTACVEVTTAEHHIILDAGSGLRELGLALLEGPFGKGEGTAHLFMSHTHWDHIQGFPFFVPAYIPGNRLYIYNPEDDIEERFNKQQVNENMFPKRLADMDARKEFVTIGKEGVDLGEVKVSYIKLPHPGGAYAYRIEEDGKVLIYATDGEYKNVNQQDWQRYLKFFSKADALIFDAMYTFDESVTKEGWGHSTSLVGVDIAVKTGISKLILFHHEPTYNDGKLNEILEKTTSYYSLVRQEGHLEIILAVEGLELEI